MLRGTVHKYLSTTRTTRKAHEPQGNLEINKLQIQIKIQLLPIVHAVTAKLTGLNSRLYMTISKNHLGTDASCHGLGLGMGGGGGATMVRSGKCHGYV